MSASVEIPAQLRMSAHERRATAALTGIYATRILGLFLLLPVLDLYVRSLPGGSQQWAGLAVGAYALAQGLLQIPAGRLSDRIGRRPVILGGLALFVLGSLLGAAAHSVAAVVAARLLQGAGAISSAVTALLADVTRPTVRTRAMAIIGISIGLCFVVSLLAGPPLDGAFGVQGIFMSMALLGVAAAFSLWWVPVQPLSNRGAGTPLLHASLWRAPLLQTYIGIFSVHFSLTSIFIVVPQILRDELALPLPLHWRVYAIVFAASLLITVPLLRGFERSSAPERITRMGIAMLAAALIVLAIVPERAYAAVASLVGFFGAFNFLEAQLPARLSLVAPAESRGSAMGIFATAQFIGAGVGGAAAGLIVNSRAGVHGVFGIAALVVCGWLASFHYLQKRAE